ncbi:hypothetical protein BKA70DRAFT_1407494, partial [Coprinopsis sp. MPI-PUGE-AT-0042]
MDTTDMLAELHSASAASATIHSGEETAWNDDLSPTIEGMTLEELDVGGSEFSWSSIASGPSASSADAPAVTLGTSGEEVAVAKETPPLNQPTASTATRTEHGSAPSMQKHSLYFWDSIMFKVEGVIFQLPKYRFVEDSEVFMKLVTTSEGDGVIELGVVLVEFESFLKAFLPRASAMYGPRSSLTKDEWISVLKLSTKWLFNDLRQLAISNLCCPHLPGSCLSLITDPIERICLAKEYNVYDWLLDGYQGVIQRLLSVDDPHAEPMTLTALEGKRIGMDVALELSGIAIRRMRLAERKAPLRDMKSQRSEEAARKKVEEEVREKAKAGAEVEAKRKAEAEQEKTRKEMEEKAAQRVLEEEVEKERAFKEAERKKEAEMELNRQGEKAKNEARSEEVEEPKSTEGLAQIPKRMSIKGRLAAEARKREVGEEEVRRMVAEWQEFKREREEEDRKRKDAEDRRLRALAEEELRRRQAF